MMVRLPANRAVTISPAANGVQPNTNWYCSGNRNGTAVTPTAHAATNSQSVPETRTFSNAISAAAMPPPSANRPGQSSLRTEAAGPPRINLSANRNPTMPIGMFTAKIHRQLPRVAIALPSTGAASAGQVSSAIARTRSALSL